MAYQTRQRDPFLDSHMQALIERRGKELLGLGLVAVGVLLALMLWSFSSDDPNMLVASDSAPQNLLGGLGANVAWILMMSFGHAAWIIVLGCLGWGLRCLMHKVSDFAALKALFLILALPVMSIYAASHPPGPDWGLSVGLGGIFGDTLLGLWLNLLPFPVGAGLRIMAAAAFFGGIALTVFGLGATNAELKSALRWLVIGSVLVFHGLMLLLGRVTRGARDKAAQVQAARAARAEARLSEEPYEHEIAFDPMPEEPRQHGLFGRVPMLRARRPEPAMDMVEPELVSPAQGDFDRVEAPTDARVREKIASAIQSRVRRPLVATRAEPRLTLAVGAPAALSTEPQPAIEIDDNWVEPEDDSIAPVAPAVLPTPEPRPSVVQHNPRKAVPSRHAIADQQPSLPLEEHSAFEFPPLALLAGADTVERHHLSDEALEENARMLESVLDDYGVKGEIVSVRPGPVVTMYELEPAPGLKASRVIGLADDIARSMSALSARVSTVPGRTVIGIELPNQNREKVVLREILSSRDFGDGNHRLPLALGKDIGGDPVIANLAKMPHLLIAGTTGSGKSVAINTMILSLLYKLSPEDCRLIMIDPKMLELSVYDGIPHLLSPVVTDPKKAVVALKWVVGEMEERYRKMSKMGVRNIEGYNGRVRDALSKGEMFKRTFQTGFDDATGEPVFETEEYQPEAMPFIVVVVDEMADLMMVAGKEIEACIQRLAQMARASGIHLIMATQRPSVDVITGTIKANFPTRISFHVTSKVDSRTILGEMGAEQLLGMGDMLYMAGGSKITRVHGPFVSDEEVEEIVSHLKSFGPPDYAAQVLNGPDEERESDIDAVLGLDTGGNTNGEDALYDQAVAIVINDRKCSTSYIQRKLAIGYNKAARLVEQMEEQGLVSPANHVGKREILVPEPA